MARRKRYAIVRTPRARQDLVEIGAYTLRRWGRAQMERYLQELDQTISSLADKPQTAGQSRAQIRPDLRSIAHRRYHFIFYRVVDDRVEILRVLHQRRDWINTMASDE